MKNAPSTSHAAVHMGHAADEPMPAGISNIYFFDWFNTTSWIVILGSPMLLYLQHLNATATVVAVACSFSPLLISLQIPAASFVEQIGYRRFVLSGWTTRSFTIIGMAVVAFLPESIDRTTRLVLMLFFTLIFNILRGISTCGLLPWFTHIVPESRRGEFLARDQSAVAFSGIISLCVYGVLLSALPSSYSFGILFVVSFAAATVSLTFLRRVPDVPVEKISRNREPRPWMEMLLYPPFLRYLRFNIIVNTAMGASGVFWVRYMEGFEHIPRWGIPFISACTSLVLAMSLVLIAPIIDRTGNKHVLTLACLCLVIHFLGWGSVAAGLIPFHGNSMFVVIAVQALTSGFGISLWGLANVRMVMGIVPVMGRPHFLALYSVCSSLTLGTVPLLWGPVMDGLDGWHSAWGWWDWNCYSLLYCTMAFTMIVGLCVLQTLDEPHKMTWDDFMRELLVKTPGRALSRIITRLRGPSIG